MRALLYLLTPTLCCFLKNVNCVITFEEFKNDPGVMHLVAQYYNRQITAEELLTELNNIGHEMSISTLYKYLNQIKKAGGGSRISYFDKFKNNPRAMFYIEQYNNNNQMTQEMLLTELNNMGFGIGRSTLERYLSNIKKGGGTSYLQVPQIARQSSNFTSGNPGSSTSALNKGKSINFSKASNSDNWSLSSITGLASHYGAMPSQQVPPMDDTFVPSQAGTDSMNWLGENLQSNDGDLDSVVRPKNTSLFKRALGFMSSLGGASPQEPQFSPSMHDTSAASSYYPSNQPDDGTLQSMITPRNQKASHYGSAMSYQQVPPVQDTFVPSQAGTDSTNFFGWNSQNNDGDLASVFRPKNTSSSASKGFYGTPFLPNQSQSTRRTGASNYFSPTPNTSNFTSGNPGSSSYYGSAMPFQQAPMSGTSFPAFPNYPSNQSAQLNSSTNFMPSQPGTPFWDWSGGNSQNNDGDLYSVVRPKKPSSSRGNNATKTGKKPRK